MDKPKIIVFSTAYLPYIGGAEIAIENVAKRLSDRFDFLILTSRFRRDLPKHEIRAEGVIRRFGFGVSFDKFLLIPFSFIYIVWKLKIENWKLHDSRGIVLWGVDTGQASLAAALLKFIFPSVKFILTLQYGESEEYLKNARAGLVGSGMRFILGRAEHVTAISSYLLDLARRYGYRGAGEVIHNGVDIHKFKIQNAKFKIKDENSKIIVTTSRLVKKNGIDTLINSITEVKKEFPDIQCHIIGDGPESQSLKLKVESLKLENYIKFFGAVPHENIPGHLHTADVFVRPSRSEGMGNSFVEALAAGLPIIGTPVGGITDIIRDGESGFLVGPDDPRALAEKIIYVLKNPAVARDTVISGKKMTEDHFSWDKIASAYTEVFENARADTRLLVATPLLPPQLGGPALYAKNLPEEFRKSGMKVDVVSFGDVLKYPSGIRHLLYFFTLLRYAVRSDIIFALDYTSVGFPAACVAVILRKKLVIRVEGDFLWESYVERIRKDVTLAQFYKDPPVLSRKERFIKAVSGWVMRRAGRLIFSSEWRRKMVVRAYNIPPEKTGIIRNAYPHAESASRNSGRNIILWAGRMLYLKNLHRLIRAFADTHISSFELHLVGEGPEKDVLERLIKERHAGDRIKIFPKMGHDGLMREISSAAMLVLPSLSDVGPNIVAEAVGSGIHVIMTGESGFAEYFPGGVELIDPLDENDIRRKLEKFMKEPHRMDLPHFAPRSWVATAHDWIKMFQEL